MSIKSLAMPQGNEPRKTILHFSDGTVITSVYSFSAPKLEVPEDVFPMTKSLLFDRDDSPDSDGYWHYRQTGTRDVPPPSDEDGSVMAIVERFLRDEQRRKRGQC